MSEFVYPLDGTQNYTAAQAGAFNGTRTSGVWSGEDNLAVSIGGTNTLSLSAGLAWFTTDVYHGKVYCNPSEIDFTTPAADGALDRILRVVVRWNKTNNTAKAMLLTGSLSGTPVAPARSTTNELYDLVLADYYQTHGETELSAGSLTDQRLNEDLCGLMRDGVTRIPTAALNAQFLALLAELEYDLQQVIAGDVPAHAFTHAAGGADAVTPAAIGAAELDANGKVAAEQTTSRYILVAASRALTAGDAGCFLECYSSSDITITVPLNVLPVGTEIEFFKSGTGALIFAAASGVTLHSIDNAVTVSEVNGCCALKNYSGSHWILSGALS